MIKNSSLHIQLAYHTFSNSPQLSWSTFALSKIKVHDKVRIVHDEEQLDMSLGDLPDSLCINAKTMYSHFKPYNSKNQYSSGCFNHRYGPENHIGKDADPQHDSSSPESVCRSSDEANVQLRYRNPPPNHYPIHSLGLISRKWPKEWEFR